MDKDVSGVRISPASLDFYDTVTNTVEQLNITVKNISKGSKSIRFYGPKTKELQPKIRYIPSVSLLKPYLSYD